MELNVIREMVDEFQCPGCTCGVDTKSCSAFKIEDLGGCGWRCKNHSAGTFMGGVGAINLGLPKGFNRVKKLWTLGKENYTNIRLHPSPKTYGEPNVFNVAVWVKKKGDYLFIRTFSPRIDQAFVDVIKGGDPKNFPNAIDVTDLEMD